MHEFGDAYIKSTITRTPPGMPPKDHAIWEELKHLIPDDALLWFNVRIGKGSLPGRVPANAEERMLWLQTAKRIDLVLQHQGRIQLIELHHRAGPSAVGRLLCYASCWVRETGLPRPFTLMLVTDEEDGDMRSLCEDHAITYLVLSGVTQPERIPDGPK